MRKQVIRSTFFVLVLVLVLTSTAKAEIVGWWRLDEGSGTTISDSSGNGNNGTIVGKPTWIAGIQKTALEFHGLGAAGGGGDYINCGNSASLDITGPISIALWIRPDADDPEGKLTTTAPMAKAMDGMSPSWSFQVRYGWGQGAPMPYMSFTFPPSGTTPRAWAHVGRKLERHEWCHIACSFDGTTLKCYLNGKQTNSTAMGGTTSSPTPVLIGSDGWGCDWIGAIDDVRMYNHALSEGEILGTMAGEVWPYAYGPNPEDGALLTDTWVNLSWKPGGLAVSHDVYLGDNLGDVEQATHDSAAFRGNQTGLFFVAGFPGFAYPNGLVPGTTYYWRIDEVNAAEPNSPWKGPIWHFSIPPKTAYNPSPANGAEFVGPDNVTLTWTPGFGAKLHHVYLGTNLADVEAGAPGVYKGPAGVAKFGPAKLEAEKVYYWRIDEFDGTSTYKGGIWAFTTPGAAGNPKPANGAAGVQMVAKLSWTPATNATSHQVYFGTDKEAVKNATTASAEYKGSKAKGSESYDPGKLAWYSPYYWRVDAVYSTGTVKGLVWSFTTADFITVDDFESYNDIDPPAAGSNRIFDKWTDGFATPTTNGALVGNDLPPYAEKATVHGGAQSMPYRYDNANKTSEATMTLVYPRNWTEDGVTKLSLWHRGSSANSAERMFVALNGNAVVYHADPAATKKGGWNQWVIDLAAFQGVTLTNVNTISIGFGTKGSPAAGGTGKVYFDDIRLIRP